MQGSPDPQDPAETLPPPIPAHHAVPVWWTLLLDWAIASFPQLEESPALQQGLLSLFGHCILCGLHQWHLLNVASQARAGLQPAFCVVPAHHDKDLGAERVSNAHCFKRSKVKGRRAGEKSNGWRDRWAPHAPHCLGLQGVLCKTGLMTLVRSLACCRCLTDSGQRGSARCLSLGHLFLV